MARKKMESKYKLRIIFWLILAIFVVFLLYSRVVPGGVAVYVQDWSGENKFISGLSPVDRIIENKKIVGDPVYFTLSTPRRFEFADLKIFYHNNSERPLIQAGILADKDLWRYQLYPLENKLLDTLMLRWSRLETDGTILLQRNTDSAENIRAYNSVKEFIADPPIATRIASFNYYLRTNFILPNYEKSIEQREFLAQPIRGDHQFYVYLSDEDLDLNFLFSDLNQNKDPDPIQLNLYYQDRLIASKEIADDGISDDTGNIHTGIAVNMREANLPAGAYKIELRVNSDIVTDSMSGTHGKLAFINKLWVYDRQLRPGQIYTDARLIRARSSNPSALQDLQIENNESLGISETYRQFQKQISGTSTAVEIKYNKGDILIEGSGNFSFEPGLVFNPAPRQLDEYLDLDSIDYVIAKYQSPVTENDSQIATSFFNLGSAYSERKPDRFGGSYNYSLMISVPGLLTEDGQEDYLQIDRIEVRLHGKSLIKKIKELILNK